MKKTDDFARLLAQIGRNVRPLPKGMRKYFVERRPDKEKDADG